MASVDALIFTRDRPAQLELLLRTMRRHAPELYASVTVQWRSTRTEFTEGYARAFMLHRDMGLNWSGGPLEDERFEDDVRRWLAYPPGDGAELVSFLVDDDAFYADVAHELERPPAPYSLRGGDYWYPFSVDGNVYRRDHIVRLLRGVPFNDPTELEARGHELRGRLPFGEVYPHSPPCLVGVPHNVVSPSSGMGSMNGNGDRVRLELNRRFHAGDRLELPPFAGPLEAHAELVYDWLEAPAENGGS